MGRRRERDDHHDHGFREWGPPPHVRRMMARGGFGPGWGGGPRARRGDVRTGVLQVLSEEPMHGYDVIRALEERSGGRWRSNPRTCAGEVCVRRRLPPSSQNVSCMSRAGCSGGIFSASKL